MNDGSNPYVGPSTQPQKQSLTAHVLIPGYLRSY